MKKFIFASVITLLLISLLVGCASSPPSAVAPGIVDQTPAAAAQPIDTGTDVQKPELPSGTITWLCNNYQEKPQLLVDAYNKLYNPNLEVQVEIYPRTQLMETIEIKLGSQDSSFDVFFVDQPLVSAYEYRDYLVPLTQYFTQEEINDWTDADKSAGYISDELMVAPLMSSTQALFYNKDLLREAGISLPGAEYENYTKRYTWEELTDIFVQTQQAIDPHYTKGLWAFSFDQIDNVYQILALPNSLGSSGIAEDGITTEGVLNSPAWIQSLQFYQDLYQTHKVSPLGVNATEIKELFLAGKIAFYLANTTKVTQSDFEVGYALHPYFEGGVPATPTGAWYLGINKYSKSLDASVDFVKWVTAGDGAEEWLTIMGQLPAKKSLLTNIGDGKYEMFNSSPMDVIKIGIVEAEEGAAYPRPRSPGFLEFTTQLATVYQDIRSGADVKQTLDHAAAQLQSSFVKYAR